MSKALERHVNGADSVENRVPMRKSGRWVESFDPHEPIADADAELNELLESAAGEAAAAGHRAVPYQPTDEERAKSVIWAFED